MKTRTKNSNQGFTLIELIVALLIFSLIVVGIIAVFVASINAYQKSKAIKKVKEDSEFAMNSIAKDVRMGKIETTDSDCIGAGAGTSLKKCVMVTRNRGQDKACYKIVSDNLSLGVAEGVSGNTCPSSASSYQKLIDLADTGMSFDSSSGFYGQTTGNSSGNQTRGWAEMNFNIKMSVDAEMETDQINIQTAASSRDYGEQ
jgi:prepilin-type N-terminal cleavage/methylation domain-containing protein